MKFRYVGNPQDLKDLHPQITAFGLTFPLDEPVEVTDPRAVRKLKSNTHFEAVLAEESGPETGTADAVAMITPELSLATPEASVPSTPVFISSPPSQRGGRRRG